MTRSDPGVELVSLRNIEAARDVIDGRLHRTPVAGSSYLSGIAGANVVLKLELFQKTGSFKPRGVLNALHHLTPDELARGVVSLSAGNHAQAVAWGAREVGTRATIVMPATAQASKVRATQEYGGEVIQTDGDLLAATLRIQQERNLVLLHPFDDPHVIAGQGTVGLEIVADVPDVATVLVTCGGGGLLAGVAAAIKRLRPHARVIGIEPEGAPGMTRSLAEGRAVKLESWKTIADGLAAPFAGVRNYHHAAEFVDEMFLVTDDKIREALGTLIERCKIVPEPAAAAAIVPLLDGRVRGGGTIVPIICGGNIDRHRLKELL